MRIETRRRKRRRANAKLRTGGKAVRSHNRPGGRTGSVQAKRTPAARVEWRATKPNPPGPTDHNLG